MKIIFRLVILLVVLCALAVPTSAYAQAPGGDEFIFGNSYTLASGKTLDSNLVALGGTVVLETGSVVTGNVTVTGGSLLANGEIKGNVSTIGGAVTLGNTAVIDGNFSTLGGSLQQASTAVIKGELISGSSQPTVVLPGAFTPPSFGLNFKPFFDAFWLFFRTIAIAALAILVALFWPRQSSRIAETVISEPVISGGLGLLTLVVAPIILVVIGLTLILIPVSLLGILVLAIAIVLGWIAVGVEVGQRLAALLKANWPIAVSAGLGTFVLTFIVYAIGFIPVIGWIAPVLVTFLGLGAVVISRFGTQLYHGHLQTVTVVPPPSQGPTSTPEP